MSFLFVSLVVTVTFFVTESVSYDGICALRNMLWACSWFIFNIVGCKLAVGFRGMNRSNLLRWNSAFYVYRVYCKI